MKITNITSYKDGGTIELTTDEGPYYIDFRLGSKTPGVLYKEMPKANSIPADPRPLYTALKQHPHFDRDHRIAAMLEKLITRAQ